MKRTFLVDLGLEDAVVDKIMAEHGKTTQRLQDKIEATKTELTQAQNELTKANDKVKEFEKVDVEGLKSEAEEWKNKYNSFERDTAVNSFFKDYKFTSDLAKKAAIEEFKNQNFELKEGKFDGADKFMKDFIKNNESAFVKEDHGRDPNPSSTYSYKPNSGNSGSVDPFTAGLNDIFGKGDK